MMMMMMMIMMMMMMMMMIMMIMMIIVKCLFVGGFKLSVLDVDSKGYYVTHSNIKLHGSRSIGTSLVQFVGYFKGATYLFSFFLLMPVCLTNMIGCE